MDKSIIKKIKKHFFILFRKGKNIYFFYGTEGGEIRLPFSFFLRFLIFCYFDESFFSLAYLNLTFLVVLSHARDTKFVVENFFESSYFSVHYETLFLLSLSGLLFYNRN